MVSLKLDLCNDRPASPDTRPQLVLKDLTTEERPRQSRSRRNPLMRFENAFFGTAAAAALLYFVFSFTIPIVHSVQQNYTSPLFPRSVVISKTVAHGDTLAKLAYRYGDPNTYILEREDQIARVNHLEGTAPLLPGQHLQIPVTNPIVIAQIIRSFHHHLVASR
ncbi:MAG: LysM peptidoglycan-binding domain-containing protein [Janthinobacterium lividum]